MLAGVRRPEGPGIPRCRGGRCADGDYDGELRLRGGDDNPFTIEMQGNRNLTDAAKAAGVDHFIFVSILAYDPNSPNPFFAGKGQAEDYLVNSGLQYTILAPDIFAEVWFGMVFGGPLSRARPSH